MGNAMFRRIWFHVTHPTKSSTRIYRHLGYDGGLDCNPWALIRIHNEIATLEDFLLSIEGVITRGVITYNQCTDGSEEVIKAFGERNPGYIILKYDKEVIPVHDERYKGPRHEWEAYSMATYSNLAFSHIPVGDWFIKLDADHIFDSEKLRQFIRLPEHSYDLIQVDSLNCVYTKHGISLYKPYPLRIVGDDWLMKKTDDLQFKTSVGYRAGKFYAYETFRARARRHILTDITNWHFLYQKERRQDFVNSNVIESFEEWKKSTESNYEYLPKDMLDVDYIKSFIHTMQVNTRV